MTTAKDEVNVALNVAALVIVPALVVKEGIVGAVKGTVVERRLVAGHQDRNRLVVGSVGDANRSIILCNNGG